MNDRLHIHDWNEHQTYRRDRGQPPWIKVHREAMRNPKWVALTDAERGQLVSLWMLAADNDGWIKDDPHFLKKICCMESEPDLQRFISLGFIDSRRQDDDGMTSTRRHDDALEAEAETEVEAETENSVVGLADEPESDPIEELVELVSELRQEHELPALRGGDKAGRRYIRARLREHGYELVEQVVRYAPSDPWIQEEAEIALRPIFSPNSFPGLLSRMDAQGQGGGLSRSDRRLIEHRKRLEKEDL